MSIDELLENAQKITEKNPNFLLALTDHDTIDGTKEISKKIEKYKNVNICLGLEISTIGINFPDQKKPCQIHLLVYGIDPFDKKLNNYLSHKRDLKLQLAKATYRKIKFCTT